MMLQNVYNPVRRRLLQSLSAGLFGHGLGDLLSRQQVAAADTVGRCQARNVLVIYEEGGISQMDSWDPKPDAPVDHRSPFAPIATTVHGTFFSSLMPRVAQHAHRLSVVRSMTSTRVAGHIEGCLEFMKGYRFDAPLFQGSELRSHRFPDIGSVVTDQLGSERAELPGYILCPGANLPNHVGNPGFLSKSCAPWKLGTRSPGEDVAAPGWRVKTLVCFITEMGRTPRLNKWQGRDHWARAMSIAFAGAGVPGGQVIGETDREAADVISQPYTPYDYAETIYRKVGIDTDLRLKLPDGRPVEFSDGGRPIAGLFG